MYTLQGQVQHLVSDKVLFRKMCDIGSVVEKRIATLLIKTKLPNVVAVYNVTPGYIDMELLDVNHADKSNMKHDVYLAMEQLHSINVVYVDFKFDNFGYSHTDKCWKVFDFDGSGILDKSQDKWDSEPPDFYMYRSVSKLETRRLVDIDMLAFSLVPWT